MNTIQQLLDSTFPFVENLLREQGEFYPLAAAVTTDLKIAQVGTYDGNEYPESQDVISLLKSALKAKSKNYLAVTLFYDVMVTDHDTGLKKDAVAVFAETKEDDTAFIFYYPYTLINKQLEFLSSWKTAVEKQILV